MTSLAEQIGQDTVRRIVHDFYQRVRAHEALSVPFSRVTDWPQHLEILTHFWWVTLGGSRYLTHPYAVAERHEEAGFTPALLVDWLALFTETVNTALPAEQANPWLERAQRIGTSLRMMHAWHRDEAAS